MGPFIPHHFDVAVTPGCAAGGFTYSGQPVGATVTARNAAGATTVNYDGSAFVTPTTNAKAVALSDAGAVGNGSFTSGAGLAASAFRSGVGSAAPTYGFASKLTAARTLTLRATDTSSVSSAGHTEGATALRSGRLHLASAFGSAKTPLQLPVAAEYWSGADWVVNSADSCTTLAAANVGLSNPRDALGAVSTASNAASAITLAAGRGMLTLAAPSPAGQTLSLDVALNLGSATSDTSCLGGTRPTTTGAALPWLRSRSGACAPTWDRDPAARASFGIFSPETRKMIHVRELF